MRFWEAFGKYSEKKESPVKEEIVLDDFTDVTKHINLALEKINKVFTSKHLTEEEKSRLGKLGRSIYWANHELDHLFMELKSVPEKLRDDLRSYYGH